MPNRDRAPPSPLTALLALSACCYHVLALVMVAVVVALVAWALQLMQAANDRQEFSLMLAGCMVCSAAVGLATVMVLTLTGPSRSGGPGHQHLRPLGSRAASASMRLCSPGTRRPPENLRDAGRSRRGA